MKKIIAVLLIALLVFAGCASAPVKDQAENKEEKKLVINQGERDIGALLVITGIALGTWWGNTWASNDNQIWTSISHRAPRSRNLCRLHGRRRSIMHSLYLPTVPPKVPVLLWQD